MTVAVATYRDIVTTQPLLGSDSHQSLSFDTSKFLDKGVLASQISNIVVISGFSNGGKTLTVTPFSSNTEGLKEKVDAIGKTALVATVELLPSGGVRLAAFSPIMEKLSAGTVNIEIAGTEKSLGKITARRNLIGEEYKILLQIFNANKDRIAK